MLSAGILKRRRVHGFLQSVLRRFFATMPLSNRTAVCRKEPSHESRRRRLRHGQPALRTQIRTGRAKPVGQNRRNLPDRPSRRRVGRRQNHLPRTGRDARLHGRAAQKRLGRSGCGRPGKQTVFRHLRRRAIIVRTQTRAFTSSTAITLPPKTPTSFWVPANTRTNSPASSAKTTYSPPSSTRKKATMPACCCYAIFWIGTAADGRCGNSVPRARL